MAEKDRLRTKKIQVFLTEAEHEFAKDKAKYSGLSMSELVRNLITEGAVIKYEMEGVSDVLKEINKIGTNINQIARKVNERDSVLEDDVEELKMQYEKIFELYINKLMGVE
ncbi:plasmid mobilization protein [Clostridium sp.]|uniref:plasmid mobilization protein n=1 Tax=Clostridium sp. TaxID=1506 RepID=UPI002847EB36|nr:plasmid mobilization relaxosome protein MobC [Clostridium sp.]MDR3598495.1 plasmid mobilization relaxosome protein MobC [Clostridium sp.]